MCEQYLVLARPVRPAAEAPPWAIVARHADFLAALDHSERLDSPKVETQVCAQSAMPRTPR